MVEQHSGKADVRQDEWQLHGHVDVEGWRARVGVVVPSPNTVLEPLYSRVAPAGVTVHFARMFIAEAAPEDLLEMDRTHGMQAVRDVVSCGADVLLYACTASSVVQGPSYDAEIIGKMTEISGKPATTVTESLLQGLSIFTAASVVIVSPYAEDIDEAERRFFNDAGVDVIASRGMGIRDPRGLAGPGAGQIYRAARDIWDPAADALILSCANFRSHEVIEPLERDLGVPVLTSTQAPLWRSLRLAGVEDRIGGLGQLLRSH
jgi:maleate isomerase